MTTNDAPTPGRAHIGCSGWRYADWRGPVYPEPLRDADWLAYYARLFDSVELNTTFYGLPSETSVRRWAASVPTGFTFSLKLGAFGTHRKKLTDPVPWLTRHVERFEALGAARGACLVQLPPRWRVNADRLDAFLAVAPRSWRWAVELRDPSWLDDVVFDVLRAHGAALCVHDLLPSHPVILTTDWTYVRFHGPHALAEPYVGAYGARRLRPRAVWLRDVLASGHDVYAYFNNDVGAAAVRDAAALRRLLGLKPPAFG